MATYAGVNTGFTQSGYTLSRENKVELINESDLYGDTIIDMVYRGGDTFVTFLSRVYKAGSITPWWPWADTFPDNIGALWDAGSPIAQLASSVASLFSMTAVAATPAVASPATLTGKAILAPGYNTELLFDSRCRNVPIRLLFIPQSVEYDYVMSRVNGNVGQSVDDMAYWLPVTNIVDTAWSALTNYVVGNLVNSGGSKYICILPHINQIPPNATYWLLVVPALQGSYNGATTYAVGDYVGATGSEAGYVFTTT